MAFMSHYGGGFGILWFGKGRSFKSRAVEKSFESSKRRFAKLIFRRNHLETRSNGFRNVFIANFKLKNENWSQFLRLYDFFRLTLINFSSREHRDFRTTWALQTLLTLLKCAKIFNWNKVNIHRNSQHLFKFPKRKKSSKWLNIKIHKIFLKPTII